MKLRNGPILKRIPFDLHPRQAQECILEKSMLDQRKNTIIAKVAAQIVDYYENQLTKSLDSEVVAKTLGSKKVTTPGRVFF